MRNYIIKWLTTSLAVFLVPNLVTGIEVRSYSTALCIALVLGLLNTLVRPVLFFITLPFTILTLGFFTLILNAFMFELAAKFVNGVYVANFASAFWGSLVVTIISWLLQLFFKSDSGPRVQIHTYRSTSNGRQVRDV